MTWPQCARQLPRNFHRKRHDIYKLAEHFAHNQEIERHFNQGKFVSVKLLVGLSAAQGMIMAFIVCELPVLRLSASFWMLSMAYHVFHCYAGEIPPLPRFPPAPTNCLVPPHHPQDTKRKEISFGREAVL